MDFLVDGGRRRHPQKETAVYTRSCRMHHKPLIMFYKLPFKHPFVATKKGEFLFKLL
jgi:hypothetical protein